MKRIKLFFIVILSFSVNCIAGIDLYNPQTQERISLKEGVKELRRAGIIILGETHYTPLIQQAQGQFIEHFVSYHQLGGDFNVAWEFLEFPRQSILDQNFSQWVRGERSFESMLTAALGGDPGDNSLYRPIFEAAKKNQGKMIATNAPRSWKKKVIRDGFSGVRGAEVPRGLIRGSDAYYERFIAAMGGHGDANTFESYFLAQSYTDAVMADQLDKNHDKTATIMVVGHFHSDFFHGLPSYLVELGVQGTLVIDMVDGRGLNSQELAEALKPHPKYGARADYFLIID